MHGTSLVARAFVMAEMAFKDGEIMEQDFKRFTSEVVGALDGKTSEQRGSERMSEILDETLGPPPLRAGEDDTSKIQPSVGWPGELPELNGHECHVRLVYTATGFALVRQDDGTEITERRSLNQKDLENVQADDWGNCRYVNLRTRDGEIVSCLIVGEDHEIIGSPRAFWWALAKVTVKMADVRASGVLMSVRALAHVHNAARAMWDKVLERSRSIEELRHMPPGQTCLAVADLLLSQHT
jgi:hypothetical protein